MFMDMSYIKMLRPTNWVKNFAVVLPLFFAMKAGDIISCVNILEAALIFCLLSSFVYIINDINDQKSDIYHPYKKDRPIASGRVSIANAVVVAAGLLFAAFLWAYLYVPQIIALGAGYIALQMAYTFGLKRIVLLDVICIALGFVIRAAAGAVAIDVAISPWLFICMFTVCLFMGFCKRYNERATFDADSAAAMHRDTLLEYTPQLLTHLVTLSAGIAVISFISYAMNPLTIAQFGSEKLVYTLPVVVYAVFRFAMISMKAIYEGPTEIILQDRPFQISVAVWFVWLFAVINLF